MTDHTTFRVTVLGARGSIPTDGENMLEFGGATSCYMVEAGEQLLYLDAGSGLTTSPLVSGREIAVLLTHPHLDHLQGLPFFPALSQRDNHIDIYLRERGGITAWDTVDRVFSPPIWPCTLRDYPARVECRNITFPFRIGDVEIDGMESAHPGGSVIYKLTFAGKTLVYATDFEHNEEKCKELIAFAKEADLLLYDGQYTEEEFEIRKGYGHSTAEVGLRVKEAGNIKRLLLVHHDPGHPDEMLRRKERQIGRNDVSYARRLEVIDL